MIIRQTIRKQYPLGHSSLMVLCFIAAILLTSSADGDTIVLSPVADALATDQPRGGVFDTLITNSPAYIFGGGSLFNAEYRGVAEISLAGIPSGAIITSAPLKFVVVSSAYANDENQTMNAFIHGYAGNGTVAFSDLNANNPIAGPYAYTINAAGLTGPDPLVVDVAPYLQTLVDSGQDYFGFVVRAQQLPRGFIVQFGSSDNGEATNRPTLTVNYVVPEPSSLLLLAIAAPALLLLKRRQLPARSGSR